MSDQTNNHRPLSEIGHLFLSSVRDKHTGSTHRPMRLPPGAPRMPKVDVSIDLTPEEFEQMYGGGGPQAVTPQHVQAMDARPTIGPVSAVIGPHLNGKQFDRVKQYARHLARDGDRVGLIELDPSEFRLMCFDRGHAEAAALEEPAGVECFDARSMTEGLEELSWDIDRWLVLLPNPRVPEARALLREINHWVLLSTCDHDGVVSAYRTIKGMVETHRPRLTLALLDAADETEAAKVSRKLSGVCQQFLGWPLFPESPVKPSDDVTEHMVMLCRPSRDKAQLATAPQWQVVASFLGRAREAEAAEAALSDAEAAIASAAEEFESAGESNEAAETVSESQHVADIVVPDVVPAPAMTIQTPVEPATVAPSTTTPSTPTTNFNHEPLMKITPGPTIDGEVTDLPEGEATEAAVLAAVLRRAAGALMGCPIQAPACPQATLAVDRDRRLTILAVARQGLGELRSIGQAYQWLIENRALIAMAIPQLSVDAMAMPALRLLVDHADMNAGVLQPLLQSSNVTVQTYRKLRWGAKTGLLLEAA